MSVNWYNVGNKTEFLEKGIPQETKTLDLEDLGRVDVVFLNGFNFSVIFNGEMLIPELNGKNPWYTKKNTCYVDKQTNEVWVGYETED